METIIDNQSWFIRNLETELKESLKEYTDEAYKSINKTLREGKNLSVQDQRIVNHMDMIFEMVDPITETLTLYRGVKSMDQIKADKAFLSASYDLEQAKEFTKRDCCIIVFNIPPGSKVLFVEYISEHPYEKEVIIDRQGDFKITLVNEGSRTREINKVFVTYIPKISVSAKVEELDKVLDSAIDQMSYIQRVVDIFPEDEYELFKDDEETLESSVKDIFKQLANMEPSESLVKTISERLKNKYK